MHNNAASITIMRRRKRAARFRPLLKSAAVAMAAAIDDVSGQEDCRHLLIRVPDDWRFSRIDDHRLARAIDTVALDRRNPDGLPAGRYLRLPIEPLVDPWGRVSVGLEFDTPTGTQTAELSVQTRDDRPDCDGAAGEAEDGIRLYAQSLLQLTGRTTIFFVEGSTGDVVDLTDDEVGRWSQSDSDGQHTLYIRRDRSGRRSGAIAVRCGIEVKLG
jgi:hypothetical protein